MKLEDIDLGKPTNPKIRIISEWEIMKNYYKPYAIQNKDWHWLYNFKAAKLEAKFLWKKLPTDRQWSKLAKTKNDIPNIVYAGYCYGGSCKGLGYDVYYWSSSVVLASPTYNWARRSHYALPSVNRFADDKENAFSVRCLKD